MIPADFGWEIARKAVAGSSARRLFPCFVDPRRTQVTETPEKEPQAEALSRDTQLDHQAGAPHGPSSRRPTIVVSLLTLVLIGAAAAAYALPNLNIALPNFSSLAELRPRETASAPIPDPVVTVTLKDIQSGQQQNATALQENGVALQQNTTMLQQGAATLESFRQSFTTQQTDLKRISSQLSSLMARVDSLQNAMTPLTTSSIPQPNPRARPTSRKKTSRLPKPFGPVSVGGAPLTLTPTPGSSPG
jgi:uncharacterized coiled-coil protein SlyX